MSMPLKTPRGAMPMPLKPRPLLMRALPKPICQKRAFTSPAPSGGGSNQPRSPHWKIAKPPALWQEAAKGSVMARRTKRREKAPARCRESRRDRIMISG